MTVETIPDEAKRDVSLSLNLVSTMDLARIGSCEQLHFQESLHHQFQTKNKIEKCPPMKMLAVPSSPHANHFFASSC